MHLIAVQIKYEFYFDSCDDKCAGTLPTSLRGYEKTCQSVVKTYKSFTWFTFNYNTLRWCYASDDGLWVMAIDSMVFVWIGIDGWMGYKLFEWQFFVCCEHIFIPCMYFWIIKKK